MDKGEQEAAAQQPGEPSEGEVSADELVPTPPDSPLPSTGAFAPIPSGGPDLDDEFYAIPSNPGSFTVHSFIIQTYITTSFFFFFLILLFLNLERMEIV